MPMRAIERRNQGAAGGAARLRAFVLPYVMMIAVVMIAITGLILARTQTIESNTRTIEEKNSSFNAAEAGLNAALDALDRSILTIGGGRATLSNGYKYSYSIYPNLLGSLSIVLRDPVTGQRDLVIPALSAVIVSKGSGPNNERPSIVEALVTVNVATINFQRFAIIAGRNIQGTDQLGIRDVSATRSGAVHAGGSINASLAGGIEGSATATGDTNTLPPYTTHADQIALPAVSHFDTMVSNYENQTKLFPGPANIYVPDGGSLSPSYVCPTSAPATGCLLFFDGKLVIPSQQVAFSGKWTFVINGDLQQTGVSSLTFSGMPGTMVVNGNASLEGNGVKGTYLMVKGSTQFGGTGSFRGALITLGNFTFDANSSSGWFDFDPSVVPPPKIIAGRVKVVTYSEF